MKNLSNSRRLRSFAAVRTSGRNHVHQGELEISSDIPGFWI